MRIYPYKHKSKKSNALCIDKDVIAINGLNISMNQLVTETTVKWKLLPKLGQTLKEAAELISVVLMNVESESPMGGDSTADKEFVLYLRRVK